MRKGGWHGGDAREREGMENCGNLCSEVRFIRALQHSRILAIRLKFNEVSFPSFALRGHFPCVDWHFLSCY